MKIPDDANFTQIVLEGRIVNLKDVNEGFDLKVNFGDPENTTVPTETQYDVKGEAEWNDGLVVTLSKEEVSPGNVIRILIYLPLKMKVEFTTHLVNGNVYDINMNQNRKDYVSYKEDRIYKLDLSKFLEEIKDDDIDVTVTVYSGSPKIEIAFD